jgi:hypothetical protein
MDDEYASGARSLTLMDESAVQPYLIRGFNSDSERCKFAIDSDPPSPDPILNFPSGSQTCP